MKNKKLIGLLGAAVVMTAVSGCSSKKEPETEADTLVISDMEVVENSETEETGTEKQTESVETESAEPESDTEALTEQATEAMTIELSGEGQDSTQQAASHSGDIVEPETDEEAGKYVEKSGEAEPESESETESETETEILAAMGGKQVQNKRETEHAVKPQRETQKQSETQAAQTEVQKQSETQTEVQKQSETQVEATEAVTEKVTESEPETEEATEAVTEKVTESESETEEVTEAATEEATESESETEEVTEAVTEELTESESETEEVTEAMTEKATESEPETEEVTEAVTEEATENESETEAVTEKLTEAETEEATEADAASHVRVVGDRVNVRQTPSLDGEIKALLTPGMQVLAVQERGEWTEVRYESENGITEGFIKSEFLHPFDSVYIANDNVNVRAEASTDAEKLGILEPDDTVIVQEQLSDGWSVIRYATDTETRDAYVKTEFLDKVDAAEMKTTIIREAERLLREAGETLPDETEAETETEKVTEAATVAEAETEEVPETVTEAATETEEITEAATEIEAETEKATEAEAETEEVPETATETEKMTEAVTEAAAETEEITEAATESETEETEPVTEAITETESETEEVTEAVTETVTETEEATEAVSETEEATETEAQTEPATEAVAEPAASHADGAEGQFELAKLLLPELQTVGIIYSAGDSEAQAQAEEYTQMAADYGVQVVTTQIEQEIDIDLAASELVGTVDCVFCIDDELVNTLVQTVRAYADEMEIPVIGIMEQQVKDGCVAAFDDDTLYWNTEEAGKLGFDVSGMNFATVKEY